MDSKTYTEFGYRGAEEVSLLNKEIDRLKKRVKELEYDINKINLDKKIDNE